VCVFGAAGCIEPTLRYCDSSACPISTTCVDGAAGFACVDDSLLVACTGLDDGAPCVTDEYSGACTQGICRRLTCGDGFAIDPEPCEGDDLRGNTCASVGRYPGDGPLKCTSACTLDPSECGGSCGDTTRNGPEVCEGSDLGGLTCLDLGFYGGELACSDDCTYDTSACVGSCGDGAVNGAESCDGANLDNHSCSDRDFYRGTVSCTSVCGVEYSQCEGSCGDGVVDAVEGEQCDLTPPQTACMSLGFDVGAVGCSSSCRASTDTCGRFGWEYVATIGAASYVWTDGTRTMAYVDNSQIVIYDGGASSTHPVANVGAVKASSFGIAVLFRSGSVEVWNGVAWSTVPAPLGFMLGGATFGLDLTDDGSLYVADWQCNAWVRTAGASVWTSLGSSGQTNCGTVVGYSPTNVWARELNYTGTGWSGVVSTSPNDAEPLPGETGILIATSDGMDMIAPGNSKRLAAGGFVAVERGFGRACGSRSDGTLECVIGGSLRTIAPPPGATNVRLVDGPPDALSVLAAGDLWTTRLAHWERVTQPASIVAIAAAEGAVMLQGLDEHVLDLGTGTQLVISDGSKTPKGVMSIGDHWMQWTPDAFFEIYRDGSELPVGFPGPDTVTAWGDASVAVTIDSFGELWINDITTPFAGLTIEPGITPPNDLSSCTVEQVDGRRLTPTTFELFALTRCSYAGFPRGIVFRFAAGQWSEYWSGIEGAEYYDIIVPPGDGRLVVLSNKGVEWITTDGMLHSQQVLDSIGTILAASSATDLYAVGLVDPYGRAMIWRWDGEAWRQMRVPVTPDISHASVTADVLVVAGAKLDRLNRFGF
jgi:hypothetical protein